MAQLVMVAHPEQEWVPGKLIGEEEGGLQRVLLEDGKELRVKPNAVYPISEESLHDTDDMTKLNELHQSLILHNIRQRYFQDTIYTYIGPMVVSVNPFKIIEKYDEHSIPEYQRKKQDELMPHLFAVAQNAYSSLVNGGGSQSVVISGESGAGKTEATKIVLKFLTVASSKDAAAAQDGKDLAAMILATNPILESFGNAKTIRNNNSSRFGKFIKIEFDGPKIVGAKIDNYLLEKTRVVHQAATERSYHIFYQIIHGTTPEEKDKYHLRTSPAEYDYLTNGDVRVPGIDDSKWFKKTRNGFEVLKFTQNEIDQIMFALSGILLLGNIRFEGEDAVKIANEDVLEEVIELLGTVPGLTKNALVTRLFSAGGRGTAYTVPLTYPQAIENRDALAKALYSKLFDWLVQRLNDSLRGKTESEKTAFIGVLDIYGFEIFDVNSLEQFCINYANEKLHQQFNENMFKAEQALYTAEGVPWTEINFKDNQACIDMIEKGINGICTLLDEECKVPKGTDEGFLNRLDTAHGRNPFYQHNRKDRDIFSIGHFAGLVPYVVTGWLEKNKDTLNLDLVKALKTSQREIIRELFLDPLELLAEREAQRGSVDGDEGGPVSRSRSRLSRMGGKSQDDKDKRKSLMANKMSVVTKFKNDLLSLAQTLASSARHYVRCIKPNEKKAPNDFDSKKVMAQLACNGVFETVTLRKAGFANRLTFEKFINSYFACMGYNSRDRDGIGKFLSEFLTDPHEWALGHTKVFLRDTAMEKLAKKQREVWEKKCIALQSFIRRSYAIAAFEDLKRRNAAAIVFQRHIRTHNAKQQLEILREEYRIKIERITKLQAYVRRHAALQEWRELKRAFDAAATLQKYVRRTNARLLLIRLWNERRERQRQEEERRKREEEERRKEEERLAKMAEEERLAELKRKAEEEERKRQEAERRKAEEAERERRRLEEEARAAKEAEERAKREAEEQKRKEEEAKYREEEERKKKALLSASPTLPQAQPRASRVTHSARAPSSAATSLSSAPLPSSASAPSPSSPSPSSPSPSPSSPSPSSAPLAATPTKLGDVKLALSPAAYKRLVDFFAKLSLPLADSFAAEAVDLDTMLAWKDPRAELAELGVTQKGIISKIVTALEDEKAKKTSSTGGFWSSLFGGSSSTPAPTPSAPASEDSTAVTPTDEPLPNQETPDMPAVSPEAMLAIPEGPKLEFSISFLRARVVPLKKAQSWGAFLTANYQLYVRCDARTVTPRGVMAISKFRNDPKPSLRPVFDERVAHMVVPMSWTFSVEIMDQNRTGDTRMGALQLSTEALIEISNGTHWLPLDFEGEYAGEIEVVISGIDIAPRPLDWSADHLDGYEQLVVPLVQDFEGPTHATLVRRLCVRGSRVAILSIHNFSDYFWNASMGKTFSDDLYNFYALDLRKCGRSMNPNHHPGYATHFEQYFEELHAALRIIRVDDNNARVVLMGTGTGALIATLYAAEHPDAVDALLLNSPAFSPLHNFIVPKPWFGSSDPFLKADGIMTIYHTTLHKSLKGEWDFNLEAKPIPGLPLYQTWLNAFNDALQRVQKGEVIVRVPTLVLCSAAGATTPPTAYNPGYQRADVFLNIAEVVRLAPKIGGQVRLQLIREAVHDVFLSTAAQRDEAYDKVFDFFTFLFQNGDAK